MEFVLFFIAITINFAILVIFRYLDAKNKSFNKVIKTCKAYQQELDDFVKEKFTQLKDFENVLDTSLEKGANLLDNIEDSMGVGGSRSGAVNIEAGGAFSQKIAAIDKKLAEIDDKLISVEGATDNTGKTRREIINSLTGMRKDVEAMMKELDKKKREIANNYKLFESRMKSEIEDKKNNILQIVKVQEGIFNENQKKFAKEIERVDNDIAKMNKSFISNASTDYEMLNQDHKMKYTDLSKKYNEMEVEYNKKLEMKINEYSKYIVKIEERGRSLQDSVSNELDKHKEECLLDLNAKFNTVKENIKKFNEDLKVSAKANVLKTIKDNEEKAKSYNETFKKLQEQAQVTVKAYESFMEESTVRLQTSKDDFLRELEEKLAVFNKYLENARQMGITLENEAFSEITKRLEDFKYKTYGSIEDLQKKVDNDVSNHEKSINKKYETLKESCSSMQINYNDLSVKYENLVEHFTRTIDSNKKVYIDNQNKLNSSFAQLKSTVENQTSTLIATFDTQKQKIEQQYIADKKDLDTKRENFGEQLSETISKYESMMASSVDDIKTHFDVEKSKIYEDIDAAIKQIQTSADGKTGEMAQKFEQTYKEFENKLGGIQEEMLVKAKDLQEELHKKSDDISAELTEDMEHFKQDIITKNGKFRNDIDNENIAMSNQIEQFKQEMQTRINGETQTVEDKINNLYAHFDTANQELSEKAQIAQKHYFEQGQQLLDTNKQRLSDYEQRFGELSEAVNNLNSKVENQVAEIVNDGTNQIQTLYNEGKESLSARYKELAEESRTQIDEYKNSLVKIKKDIAVLDQTYDDKFDEKINLFTSQFNTKLDKFNEQFKSELTRINDQAKEAESSFETKVSSMTTTFTNKFEVLSSDANDKFSVIKSDYDTINDKLTEMKLKIDRDVGDKIKDGQTKLDDEFKTYQIELSKLNNSELEDAKMKYEQLREDLDKQLQHYKDDIVSLRKNAQQIEGDLIARYQDRSGYFDRKIGQIQQHVDDFERQTKIFDKANSMREQLNGEIENMKETLKNIKSDKEKMNEIERQMKDIEELARSTAEKTKSIADDRKRIDNIDTILGELNKVSDNAIEKIEEVKNSRSLIDNLNEKISQTNDRYSKLESVIQEIDDKNNSIKEIKDGIATITKDVMAYNKQAEEVKDKLQLVQDKQVVYEKAFKNFADESKLILQSENDIEKVMEKFRQVDSLHADLKKREIQIEGLKSKVNEAITKYEKIDSTVDDKIRLLQTLLTTAEESPMMKSITKDEDSLRETVVRLSKAGYSTDDIMAQLNLSGGQIEYILESEKRK